MRVERPIPPPSAELLPGNLEGFITDHHLELAEAEFPGIRRFHLVCQASLATPPRTFLELLARFQAFSPRVIRRPER